MSVCYLDASAVVKLVSLEPETDALRQHAARYARRLTSRLTTVEAPRALARKGPVDELGGESLTNVLARMGIVELDEGIARVAARLAPPPLRSLDAIHLASALALGTELEAFVTYDGRLGAAAEAAGLKVMAPAY